MMERVAGPGPRPILGGVLLVLAAALAAFGITVTARGHSTVAAPPSLHVPAALTRAEGTPTPLPSPPAAPVPRAAALAAALQGPLAAPALGGRVLVRILDAASGTVLYDRGGNTPAAPASTAKLLTAAAVLTVHKPTDRFTTRVVAGSAPGTVVLVGGGDPTLTGAPAGKPGAYVGAARVSTLAAQLRAAHVTVHHIVVDSSLFTGPLVSPDWDPSDVPTDYGSSITALMVDGGRDQPGDVIRATDTAAAAGRALAARLGHPDLPVTAGRAPAGAKLLASVRSAPVALIVTQLLENSDNTLAEVLARQVALAVHQPATFLGAARAIRIVLARFGIAVGAGMHDGSGLAADDRLRPATLAAVLRLICGAAGGARAAGMHSALDGLPIAGWSGTLADRYGRGSPALGRLHAKTGTLTGVSSLAGVIHDASGRLLVFALDADRAPADDTPDAEAALDAVVSTLARCGCR